MPQGKMILKRAFDIFGSSFCLLLLFPLLILIALAIRLSLGSPVLFRQTRPGYLGVPFTLFKFRTMREARDKEGHLLPDAERLTPLGKFLRRTSLDELPELFNVLRGDMSLVGPRPMLMRYLNRYTPEQFRRHEMPPGITGWAQIHGRNAMDWKEKFELDIWYVDNHTLWLDIKILVITAWKTIIREGVLEEAGGAYAEFWGIQGPPPDGPRAYPVEENETLLPDDIPRSYSNSL